MTEEMFEQTSKEKDGLIKNSEVSLVKRLKSDGDIFIIIFKQRLTLELECSVEAYCNTTYKR